MSLGEKLVSLRKKQGLSQEDVAQRINVTRQTLSKWESDLTIPNLEQVKQLCRIYNVNLSEFDDDNQQRETINLFRHYRWSYEYQSKTKIFNLPLVHINIGRGLKKAKGIIAIGNIAYGIFAIGIVSIGLLTFGCVSLALVAIGAISTGLLLGIGSIAVGTIAIGAIAIGYLAIGAVAIGIYAVGGLAIANQIGYGSVARGKMTIQPIDNGMVKVIINQQVQFIKHSDLVNFLRNYFPDLSQWLIDLFTMG